MRRICADFETLNKSPTRIWAWASCGIDDMIFDYGTKMSEFLEFVSRETTTCYFHNLKFDGTFILDYLFRNGWIWVKSKPKTNEFTSLIGDAGQWYKLMLSFGDTKLTILDSLKIIPMSVEKIPKAFGLEDRKLTIDYDEIRDEGHILTQEEIDYIKNDVVIVAKAMKIMLDEGHDRITIGSNAYKDLKATVDDWKYAFAPLEIGEDADCRKAYKGGWTYCNPAYKNKMVGEGVVYDVNSMYPHVMRDKILPYGPPKYYEGKYYPDSLYPLYICCIEVCLKLKPGKYPSIQLKGSIYYLETEYITEITTPTLLHLTNVDYDLMYENYEVTHIKYINGYAFRGTVGLFEAYVNKWYTKKVNAKEEGNIAYASIAKLFLNSSYGKLGTNPIKRQKIPVFDYEKNSLGFVLSEEECMNTGYVPAAAFITAWSRDIIIRAANACGDRFLYADTDSLHVLGKEEPNIDIDEYRLGAFKVESTFKRAKYLRAKCYIEDNDGAMDKKCAGLPKNCRSELNFDTMESGHEFYGKLMPKIVPGGTMMVKTTFKIR